MTTTLPLPRKSFTVHTYENGSVCIQHSSFAGTGGTAEHHLLFSVTDTSLSPGQQLDAVYEAYRAVWREELPEDGTAVFRRYFLSDAATQWSEVMEYDRGLPICAVSIVQQPPVNGSRIALWTYVQTGMETKVHGTGLFVASHNGYSHLWAGGLFNQAVNSEFQTRLLLNDYILMLCQVGATMGNNCIRTWFFVQNVKENYPGVVKARTEVFLTQNLTEKTHYVASTCIEGRYLHPAVLAQLDAYAVNGLLPGQVRYLHAPTHLNPTYEYGVTFERGTAVTYGDRTHLFISGTASLDNKGEVLFAGDVLKQTARILENISVLLQEGHASLADITQMIVYLRHTSDGEKVSRYIKTACPDIPFLIVEAPGFRPAWSIEIECVAIQASGNPEFPAL